MRGAEAGLRWALRLSRAALCCPLPAGEGEAPPSRPLSLGQSCHQLPFVRKGSRGLCPLPDPPPGNRGAQDRGAVGFEKATVPREGESKLAKLRPSLPKADAPHPPSWLQALPLHHHPLAGGGLPDRGGFLTLFSSWKWKPSFRQRGRQALGRGAETILESAGGGLGPAVSWVWRAGRQAVQPAGPSYLLLNFSGCFSLIMWNLCAMEASWKGKGQKADSWLVVLTLCSVEGTHTFTEVPRCQGRPGRFPRRGWTPGPRLGARALLLLELMPDDSS